MIFDVIPIGSRIIGGFIGRNKKKSCIILIIILKTPIRWFIMNRLIGVFCWKFLERVKKYLYMFMKNDIYRNGNST